MSIPRSIHRVIPAQKVNMGGIILDQPLPYRSVDQIDPFLLLHHWSSVLPGDQRPFESGVGPHPHRGFSPVTFIFQGALHHRDSRGGNSIVEAGGTQWMNSGRGMIHSERPAAALAESGGPFELIQFWVNTPGEHKMDAPAYFPLSKEDTPTLLLDDGKASVAVVAGEFGDVHGPITTPSPVLALRLTLEPGAAVQLAVPAGYNAFVYQLDGQLYFNGLKKTYARDLTWFNDDGDMVAVEALTATRAILLAAKPLGEKVVSHGPFVMNSETQIMQAIRDYQIGKMGVLIEE
jgi:quercetin 2,3-dioxygenase